jgi:beta-lactamase regulating signal transducer with metallopeptidase domain
VDHAINWLWQGFAVALLTCGLLRALHRSRAVVRYGLCWAALVAVLLLGAAALWPDARVGTAARQDAGPTADAVLALPHAWRTSTPLLISVAVLWMGLFGVRLVNAVRTVRAARAGCAPFPPEAEGALAHWNALKYTGRRTHLSVCDAVGAASVLGCGSPVIAVAPALIEHLRAPDLDRVIVHEWAHVQRRDDLLTFVQLGVRMLAGWHPAVWWLDRQLLVEREIACDEVVVAVTGSPKSYARSLASMASLRLAGVSMASVGALSSPALTRRIVEILSTKARLPRRQSILAGAVSVVLVAGASVALGGVPLVRFIEARVERQAATVGPVRLARDSSTQPLTDVGRPIRLNMRTPSKSPGRADAPTAAQTPPTMPAVLPVVEQPPGTLPSTSLPPVLAGAPLVGGRQRPAAAAPAATNAPERAGADPDSPWASAKGAGVAVGRGSQRAASATARVFTRIGKNIGQAF